MPGLWNESSIRSPVVRWSRGTRPGCEGQDVVRRPLVLQPEVSDDDATVPAGSASGRGLPQGHGEDECRFDPNRSETRSGSD
ncbi:MAG: hypothetical protein CMJ23_10755 [Phycisphaerae bacterium]|nr:hypothetical protein [Phycisphaerae bacterium]